MIGFIGTSIIISMNYNSSQSTAKTRSIHYWTTSVFFSAVTDLVLIYESVTYESRRMTNEESLPNELNSQDSELLYDWRFTVNQFVLATSPMGRTTSNFIFQLNTCSYSPYVTSSLTTGWVCRLHRCWPSPAQTFSGPSPAGLLIILYSSNLRIPQPGGPGPRTYIPQEHGGPVIHTGTGFSFSRLLPLNSPELNSPFVTSRRTE
jgi:hypothetical protein